MKILYFTATGNSLYIAKAFGGQLYSIPQMIKEDTYEFTDDKIGIVFPLHAWGVPSYVVEFLKKARFKCDYLFAVTTFGVYSGAVATHLNDISKGTSYSFACIQNCPQKAIHIKGEVNGNRYINRHIQLKEIIDANK